MTDLGTIDTMEEEENEMEDVTSQKLKRKYVLKGNLHYQMLKIKKRERMGDRERLVNRYSVAVR
jgi:hypothetical protein